MIALANEYLLTIHDIQVSLKGRIHLSAVQIIDPCGDVLVIDSPVINGTWIKRHDVHEFFPSSGNEIVTFRAIRHMQCGLLHDGLKRISSTTARNRSEGIDILKAYTTGEGKCTYGLR